MDIDAIIKIHQGNNEYLIKSNLQLIASAAKDLYTQLQEYAVMLDGPSPSHLTWIKATPELRYHAYESIFRMIAKPDMCIETNHETWAFNTIMQGWKLGEKYDIFKKENPRLKPFETLTKEQKNRSDIALSVFRLWKPKLIY